jgi:uncharacterized protein (TIGR03435 family)
MFAGSIFALAISPIVSGHTQKPAAENPSSRFVAASIKPVRWERGQYHGGNCHGIDSHYIAQVGTRPVPLGRCIFPNTVLGNIIQFAYKEHGQPSFPISGGEKWIEDDAFEIEATAENPASATEEQLHSMVKTLLSDRFKLRFHLETHEEQGFVLVSARNGRSLKRSSIETQAGPLYVRENGAEMTVTGPQVTLDSLINFLSGHLARPIRDETGLDGVYNVTLRFTPSDERATAATREQLAAEPAGQSLFTAIQEQLGLRLEPKKVSVKAFVIDHVERPSQN